MKVCNKLFKYSARHSIGMDFRDLCRAESNGEIKNDSERTQAKGCSGFFCSISGCGWAPNELKPMLESVTRGRQIVTRSFAKLLETSSSPTTRGRLKALSKSPKLIAWALDAIQLRDSCRVRDPTCVLNEISICLFFLDWGRHAANF